MRVMAMVAAVMAAGICMAGSVTMITDLEADTAKAVTGPQSNVLALAAAHTNRTDNPHGVTAAQTGALTVEADAAALAALASYAATGQVKRLHDAQSASYFQTVENGTGTVWRVGSATVTNWYLTETRFFTTNLVSGLAYPSPDSFSVSETLPSGSPLASYSISCYTDLPTYDRYTLFELTYADSVSLTGNGYFDALSSGTSQITGDGLEHQITVFPVSISFVTANVYARFLTDADGTNYASKSEAITNNQSGVVLGMASGTTVATASAGSEPVTLDQALSLLSSAEDIYLNTNAFVGGDAATTNRSLSLSYSATPWTVVYSGAVTAGQYLFSYTAPSNLVTSIKAGNQTATLYMTHAGGGGSALTCKLEGYIFDPATTSSYEYAETAAAFTVAKSATLPATPQMAVAVIPYPTNLVGDLRYQIRVKAITANSVTSVTMWGGSNSISSVSLPVAESVALGARGAIAIESADGTAGSYDIASRTLTMPAISSLSLTNGVSVYGGWSNVYPTVTFRWGTTNFNIVLKAP